MNKIATKVSRTLRKIRSNKVIDLTSYKQQRRELDQSISGITDTQQAVEEGHDPLYAVYIHAQNLLSVLVEVLQDVPEPSLDRFYNTIATVEEDYMPSGPPMSPLTTSYFASWSLVDLGYGIKKESLCSIITDLAPQLGLDKNIVVAMRAMQNSRMGIYEFCGGEGDKTLLKELGSNEVVTCFCSSGYRGRHPGELWLTRILPPLYNLFTYSAIFGTPYVLLYPGKDEWLAYLQRNINRATGSKKDGNPVARLMKYGLSENYWNEYIMQAYVNYEPDVVFLGGLPDIRASRPCAPSSEKYDAILPEADLTK